MNEEALSYSYELFKNDGYNGSIDDYKSLISSDKEALDYSYGLFKSDGYDGSSEDFSLLTGITSAEKKNQVGTQPSSETATTTAEESVSEAPSTSTEEVTQPVVQETAVQETEPTQPTKPLDPYYQEKGQEAVESFTPQYGLDQTKQEIPNNETVQADSEQAIEEFQETGKVDVESNLNPTKPTESFTQEDIAVNNQPKDFQEIYNKPVQELTQEDQEYLLSKTNQTDGWFGEYIWDDDKPEESLAKKKLEEWGEFRALDRPTDEDFDNLKSKGDDLVEKNAGITTSQSILQKILDNKDKFLKEGGTDQEYNELVAKWQKDVNQKISEFNPEVEAYTKEQNKLEKKQNAAIYTDKLLNESRNDVQGSLETVVKSFSNIITSVPRMAGTYAYSTTDFLTDEDHVLNQTSKKAYEGLKGITETLTLDVDKRDEREVARLTGDVLGQGALMIGTGAIGGGGTASMVAATTLGYMMSADEMYKETKSIKNEDGSDAFTDDEAALLAIQYGAISAPLEALGIGRGIKSVTGQTLRKQMFKQFTTSELKNITDKQIRKVIFNAAKEVGLESVEEGITEGLQYMTGDALKRIKENDWESGGKFSLPEFASNEYNNELIQNVEGGAYGGGLLGGATNAKNLFNSNYKNLSSYAMDQDKFDGLMEDIDIKLQNGDITEVQAKEYKETAESNRKAILSTQELPESKRAEAAGLVVEKNILDKAIKETDDDLATPLKEKREEISAELKEIATSKKEAPQPTISKNSTPTDEDYGTVNLHDGTGIKKVTKEEYEAYEKKLQGDQESTDAPTTEETTKREEGEPTTTTEPTTGVEPSVEQTEIGDYSAEEGTKVKIETGKSAQVSERMNNKELINEAEMTEASDELYTMLDDVDKRTDISEESKERIKSKIESEIDKIEGYEFETETKTSTTTQEGAIKGSRIIGKEKRKGGSKSQVTADRFDGAVVDVIDPETGETSTTIASVNDSGGIDVTTDKGEIIPMDTGTLQYSESKIDADGNLSVVLEDVRDGKKYEIKDNELALDISIQEKEKSLGPIEDAILEEVLEDVTTTTSEEVLKEKAPRPVKEETKPVAETKKEEKPVAEKKEELTQITDDNVKDSTPDAIQSSSGFVYVRSPDGSYTDGDITHNSLEDALKAERESTGDENPLKEYKGDRIAEIRENLEEAPKAETKPTGPVTLESEGDAEASRIESRINKYKEEGNTILENMEERHLAELKEDPKKYFERSIESYKRLIAENKRDGIDFSYFEERLKIEEEAIGVKPTDPKDIQPAAVDQTRERSVEEEGDFSVSGLLNGLETVEGQDGTDLRGNLKVQRLKPGESVIIEEVVDGKKVFYKVVGNPDAFGRDGYIAVSVSLPENTTQTIESITEALDKQFEKIDNREDKKYGTLSRENIGKLTPEASKPGVRDQTREEAEISSLEEDIIHEKNNENEKWWIKALEKKIKLLKRDPIKYWENEIKEAKEEIAQKERDRDELDEEFGEGYTDMLNEKYTDKIKEAQENIDRLDGKETDPTQKWKSADKTSITKDNLADIEAVENRTKDPVKKKAIGAIKNVIKALLGVDPNVVVNTYESQQAYNLAIAKAGGSSKEAQSSGFFEDETGEIHLNVPVLEDTTLFHEATHKVIKSYLKRSPKAVEVFEEQLRKSIPKNLTEDLDDFTSYYSKDERAEEFVTEFVARVASGEIVLDNMPKSTLQKIIDAFKSLARKAGLPLTSIRLNNKEDVLEFANKLDQAFNEGRKIDIINNSQDVLFDSDPYSDGEQGFIKPDATLKPIKTQLGVYPKVDFAKKLPTKTLKEVVDKYGDRIYFITSDATGLGYDSNGDPIYGGLGYLGIGENVDNGIGFASLDNNTGSSTLSKIYNRIGGGKPIAVMVMVQAPSATIGNYYGGKFFGRGLKQIKAKSESEYSDSVKSIKKFINDKKSVKSALDKNKTTNKLIDLLNNIDNYNEVQFAEEFIKDTSFNVRREMLGTLLIDNGDIATDKSTPSVKSSLKDLGFNKKSFLEEYGDSELSPLYEKDEAGYLVGGFELTLPENFSDLKSFYEESTKGGIQHHQFNGKVPATGGSFYLDGLYNVQENFKGFVEPQTEITSDPEIREKADKLVRSTFKKDVDYNKSYRKGGEKFIPMSKRGYKHLTESKKSYFKNNVIPKNLSEAVSERETNIIAEVARSMGVGFKKGVSEEMKSSEFKKRKPKKEKRKIAAQKYRDRMMSKPGIRGSTARGGKVDVAQAREKFVRQKTDEMMSRFMDLDRKTIEDGFRDIYNRMMSSRKAPVKTEEKVDVVKNKVKFQKAAPGRRLFNDPIEDVLNVANKYKSDNKLSTKAIPDVYELDFRNSRRIADEYANMEHNPNDPKVKKAYEALSDEVVKQFEATQDAGYKAEIYEGEGEPYKNSQEMLNDLRDNKRLYILSTENDFGSAGIDADMVKDNPMLRDSGLKDVNGKKLLVNDVFRYVHDLFGHGEKGNGFGSIGEENAWAVHSSMFSDDARRALTTETRGQNSWVNFGSHMRRPDGSMKIKGEEGYLSVTKRPFAEQKSGLLPDEIVFTESKPKKNRIKFQIIGKNAQLKQNVRDNLQVARDMEYTGEGEKSIRRATGWEKGADGKWRYEIDDIDITGDITPWTDEWKGPQGYVTKLTDLVSGKLIKAYPQLKKAYVGRGVTSDSSFGTMAQMLKRRTGWDIYMSDGIFNGDVEFGKSVLIHEIQHIIQEIEGFDKGDSSSRISYDKYKKRGGEVEARNVQKRMGMTQKERQETLLKETEDIAREDQILLEGTQSKIKLQKAQKKPKLQARTIRLAPNGKRSNLTDVQYDLVRSPKFTSWFGDWKNDPANSSKIVDENGEPMVVYHGTPDGSFDVFKEDAHFTADKKYAEGYQETYASSAGLAKDKVAPVTFEVFLNIKRPFDTREKNNADVFNSEYYRKWGMGTPLMESGLPDWNDSRDLLEWIEEESKPYDGILLDEGSSPDLVSEGKSRGVSYVPTDSNQIKLADGSNVEFGKSKSIKLQKASTQKVKKAEAEKSLKETIEGFKEEIVNGDIKPYYFLDEAIDLGLSADQLQTIFDKVAKETTKAQPISKKSPKVKKTEYDVLLDKYKALKQGIRSGQAELKRFLEGADREVQEIIKSIPKAESLTGSEMRTALVRMKNAGKEDVSKAIEFVEKTIRKKKYGKIKDLYDFAKKKAATKPKGKSREAKSTNVDGQSFFKQAARVLKAVKDGDMESLLDMMNELSENDELISDAIEKDSKGEKLSTKQKELLNLAYAVDNFADLTSDKYSYEHIMAIHEDFKTAAKLSALQLKESRAARTQKNKDIRDNAEKFTKDNFTYLYDEDGNLKTKTTDRDVQDAREKLGLPKRIKAWFKEFKEKPLTSALVKNIMHNRALLEVIDKKSKFLVDNIQNKLDRMYEKGKKLYYNDHDYVNNLINDITGTKDGVLGLRKKLGSEKIGIKKSNGKTVYRTKSEMMRILALSKNELQREKLENQGYSEDVLNDMMGHIGPEGVTLVDKIVDFLSNEHYEGVNDVFKRNNHINLPRIENYFPTATEATQTLGKDVEVGNGNFGNTFNAQTASSLKNRIDKNNELIEATKDGGLDFFSVLDNHFEETSHYKAYADGVKDISAVFSSKPLEKLFADLGLSKTLRQGVDFAVNEHAHTNNIPSWHDKFLGKFTSYVLAFKPIQVVKQATSFINAYEEYSLRGEGKQTPVIDMLGFAADFAKVLATLPKQIKESKEISATFRDRLEKTNVAELMGGRHGRSMQKTEGKVSKAASFFTRAGDIMGVLGYKANYNRDIANGMSPEKALEKFNNYNVTQQSRRGQDMTPIQRERNFITRTATAFMSTSFLMINKAYSSGSKIMTGNAKVKDYRAFALSLGAANTLFTLASNMFKLGMGDDEDKEEVYIDLGKAASGLKMLTALPIIGDLVDDLANNYAVPGVYSVLGRKAPKKQGFFGGGGVNPYTRTFFEVKKAFKDDSTGEDWFNATNSLQGLITGLNFNALKGIHKLTEEDEDNFDGAMDIMGITKSYRPGEKKQKKKKKKTSKGFGGGFGGGFGKGF